MSTRTPFPTLGVGMTNKLDRLQRTRKNFDIRETSQEQKNGDVLTGTGLVAEKAAHICYEPQLAPRVSSVTNILVAAIVSVAPPISICLK
jgi:hypothetical protein